MYCISIREGPIELRYTKTMTHTHKKKEKQYIFMGRKSMYNHDIIKRYILVKQNNNYIDRKK